MQHDLTTKTNNMIEIVKIEVKLKPNFDYIKRK